jgi:hypothetical protein
MLVEMNTDDEVLGNTISSSVGANSSTILASGEPFGTLNPVIL